MPSRPGCWTPLARTGSLAAAALDLRGAGGPSGSAVAGLRGGMIELVLALERAILAAGGRIRRSTEVAPRPIAGGGWRVGDLADAAAGAGVAGAGARRLLPTIVPGLARGRSPTFGADRSGHRLGHAGSRRPGWTRRPAAPACWSRPCCRDRAKALTHATAKWPWLAAGLPAGRHVLRLSYGRAGRPVPVDADIVDRAVADAAVLLGVPSSTATGSSAPPWCGEPARCPRNASGTRRPSRRCDRREIGRRARRRGWLPGRNRSGRRRRRHQGRPRALP